MPKSRRRKIKQRSAGRSPNTQIRPKPISGRAWVRYLDYKGVRTTERQLADRIRGLPSGRTFLELSRIATLLSLFTDADGFRDLQRLLARRYLGDRFIAWYMNSFGNPDTFWRPVFFRQQVLYLMRRVLREGRGDPEDLDFLSPGQLRTLGETLLRVNDVLDDQSEGVRLSLAEESPAERARALDELLAQLVPRAELTYPPDLRRVVARAFRLLEIWRDRFGTIAFPNGKTLDVALRERFGVSPLDFLAVTMGQVLSFYQTSREDLVSNPSLFNWRRDTFFGTMHVEVTDQTRFFDATALTLTEYARRLRDDAQDTRLQERSNYRWFRTAPLFFLNDEVFSTVDVGFLQERVFPGIYHASLAALAHQPSEDRFREYWGSTVEFYVNEVLAGADFPPGTFVPDSHFATRNRSGHPEQAFDALIYEDGVLVGIETKGGMLTMAAKYSGDRESLVTDIDRKFGRQRGKGVEQLARKIRDLATRREDLRRGLVEREIAEVRVAYPVLVVAEPALELGPAARHLERLFREEVAQYAEELEGVDVRPLTLLRLEDVEDLAEHMRAREITFVEALEAYHADIRDETRFDATKGATEYIWQTFEQSLSDLVVRKGLVHRDQDAAERSIDHLLDALRGRFGDG